MSEPPSNPRHLPAPPFFPRPGLLAARRIETRNRHGKPGSRSANSASQSEQINLARKPVAPVACAPLHATSPQANCYPAHIPHGPRCFFLGLCSATTFGSASAQAVPVASQSCASGANPRLGPLMRASQLVAFLPSRAERWAWRKRELSTHGAYVAQVPTKRLRYALPGLSKNKIEFGPSGTKALAILIFSHGETRICEGAATKNLSPRPRPANAWAVFFFA